MSRQLRPLCLSSGKLSQSPGSGASADADRALFHPRSRASPSQAVSALRVTIPRARHNERLAGGSRSRVPPDGSLCSRSCGCPFNRSRRRRVAAAALRLIRHISWLCAPAAHARCSNCADRSIQIWMHRRATDACIAGRRFANCGASSLRHGRPPGRGSFPCSNSRTTAYRRPSARRPAVTPSRLYLPT